MPLALHRAEYVRHPMRAPESTAPAAPADVATDDHLADVRRAILHLRYAEDLLIGATSVLGAAWAWALTGNVRRQLAQYDPQALENQ